jgi:probable rRNA maturation factor
MHDSLTTYPVKDQFAVSVANRQSRHAVDESQLVTAVRSVLNDSEFLSANVSVAIVDDATIHELNRRYLKHNWPTDVLSFVLDEQGSHLEGEVVLSADTAAVSASKFGWLAPAEQLLYAIHGTLHLIGYRDNSAASKREMRAAEKRYLRKFGLEQPRASSDNGAVKRKTRRPTRPGAKLR